MRFWHTVVWMWSDSECGIRPGISPSLAPKFCLWSRVGALCTMPLTALCISSSVVKVSGGRRIMSSALRLFLLSFVRSGTTQNSAYNTQKSTGNTRNVFQQGCCTKQPGSSYIAGSGIVARLESLDPVVRCADATVPNTVVCFSL